MNAGQSSPTWFGRLFHALGPALIVASVVLGPGSISSSSQVGAKYGYSMVWVVFLAAGLMIGMVAMGARLGVVLRGTMCDELAARIGRPFAAVVGLTIFFVCAGFQFGNNLGVLMALDPLFEAAPAADGQETQHASESQQSAAVGDSEETPPVAGSKQLADAADGKLTAPADARMPDSEAAANAIDPRALILVGLNAVVVAVLFGFRNLYKLIENLMKILVALMIAAFLGNFVFLLMAGRPELAAADAASAAGPTAFDLIPVIGLVGTTFSIAGAFYQAYLVREKGWGLGDLEQGLLDSIAGISVLGLITLVIMLTAAMSFHGSGVELKSAADVAMQLRPLFGPAAVVLFSLGIFAAAFSSFLVNAMIGGAMMSDGLGLGGTMDGLPTKLFTTLALAVGMLVAIFVPSDDRVGLLVFAQAMIVVGFPLLAISMIYLATRPDLIGERRVPNWMKAVSVIGLLVVLTSATLLAIKVLGNVAAWLSSTGG